MIPRPSRVWAITRRELQSELKGRRWLSVPALLVALLLPASMLPSGGLRPDVTFWVAGDVPAEVLTLENVVVTDHPSSLRFDASEPDVLHLTGTSLAPAIREALDARHPEAVVRVERRSAPSQFPRRGLLLALLAASGLTASIASSIGTERSRRTLTTLLAAAISPLEIVLGKLLAWGGLATFTTVLFTGVAVLRGVLDPGWWMLSVFLAPGATIALGLWSVRQAPDVVSATTTALRVMPLATMAGGITAAVIGETNPLLGSMVPLGGLICTAGEMWTLHPARDALVAAGSTLLATVAVVLHTASTLREDPDTTPPGIGWTAVPLPAALLLLSTFCTFVAPRLWGLAGNAAVTEDVTPDQGAWLLAAICLSTLVVVLLRQHRAGPVIAQPPPSARGVVGAFAAAGLLVAAGPWLAPLADGGSFTGVLAEAFQTGLIPSVGVPAALALIASEELLFRGVLAPRIGHGPAAAAWAIGKAPLDPIGAFLGGSAVGLVGRAGGPAATIAMRVAWFAGLAALS